MITKMVPKRRMHHKSDGGMKYLQIFLYYVQDAALFKLNLPTDHDESMWPKIFQISPEIIFYAYTKVSNICFMTTTSALTKVWLQMMFGPCIIVFLLLFYIIQTMISKLKLCQEKHFKSIRSYITKAFFLTYLLAYQQMIKAAFTILKCVQVLDAKVLYINGDIECYTWWQEGVKFFVLFNLLPSLFVLSTLPYHVKERTISQATFTMACLFPFPALIYVMMIKVKKQCTKQFKIIQYLEKLPSNETAVFGDNDVKTSQSANLSLKIIHDQDHGMIHSDIDVGGENSEDAPTDSNESNEENFDGPKLEESEEVVHTLLHHYKTLKIFGIRITWLCFHKLYRIILVVCNTYITEPITRIYSMILALIVITALNSFMKPYKENTANIISTLSYVANLLLGTFSIARSFLLTVDCKINCTFVDVVVSYIQICENVLLIHFPIVAIVAFVVYKGIKKCQSKSTEE